MTAAGIFQNRKQVIAKIVRIVAIGMALFQIYTAQFGLFSALVQRSIHLAFASLLVFLLFPITSRYEDQYPWRLRLVDWGLAVVGVLCLLHLAMTYKSLAIRGGEASQMDLWLGAILILLVLECTRRLMGWALPIITFIAIIYTFFGDRIPGMWGHFPIDYEQFISYQYLTTEGLFGIPLGVSASFIFVFIMFGAFLVSSGTGDFFIRFSNAMAGHYRGGPAKVAVVSSGFFGTISGGGQCRQHWFIYHPVDEENRIPFGVRRGCGVCFLDRRSVHASSYGRRGFYHGGYAWNTLPGCS
jgi:TRAP-type uncharacterized transport system fused permease subunit